MDNEDRASDAFSVMIVDDDPNFRALIKVLIESTGSNVLEARSGKDADQLLRDNHPNLVIVDYRLPGIDGMQWITKFREAGWTSPVIFLSGSWCDLQSFTKLRSLLKVSLILQKPIVPELFLDQIESLLPRGRFAKPNSYEEASFQPQQHQAIAFENTGDAGSEPTQAYEVYQEYEPPAALVEAHQNMEAELAPPSTTFATGTSGSASEGRETDNLRSLFEHDGTANAANDSFNSTSNTPSPRNTQAREIMRKSATAMPAFKMPDTGEKIPAMVAPGEVLPENFASVPLSKDNPDEMAIIVSEEPDVLEQLARFSQKASVEMALRNARADYAKLLPEKTDAITAALSEFKADPSNATGLDEALQVAHQLKGTSGSLGFPHLGKIAGIIETMLLDGGVRDTKNKRIWEQLERQVAQCASIAKANAVAYARPEGVPRKAFMKRVALVGTSALFETLTHDLSRESIAEAYLIESVAALLEDADGDRFNCVVVDSAALDEQSPTELLEQARDSRRLRNAPFAFIADDSWHADEALWLYTGAEFLLPQNVSTSALLSAVESMLVLNDADKPRVLTVDDDAVLTGFICDTLSANGIWASALNEPINVLNTLPEFRADLLLLDVVMPGVSGYDVCRMLRADEKYKELPILFLTSKNSPQGRAAAFKAGADDFLSKPILTEELIARVRSRLELSKPFKDRAGTNNQTGLITRQAFSDSFARSLAHASQSGNVFSVAIISIDKFEELALSFGFKTQEQVFKDLAQLLQARFRVEDLKGHWSEGSFALAFPNVEARVLDQAMKFLAGEFAVGTTHNNSGTQTMTHRLIRYGLGELLTDGVTADTLLAHAYERCMHSQPIDVSGFIALCQEEPA